jgi:hypothetical protein
MGRSGGGELVAFADGDDGIGSLSEPVYSGSPEHGIRLRGVATGGTILTPSRTRV